MKQKLKSIVACLLSLAMVITSILVDYTPAKAAETGFVQNAVITADKSMEYVWAGSEITLSVLTVENTEVTWSCDTRDGISTTVLDDTKAANGVSKNFKITVAEGINDEITVKAATSNDSRTAVLKIVDGIAPIQGERDTDFDKQYTKTSIQVKTVVPVADFNSVVWNSTDENVTVTPEDNKTDTTTYNGSAVKYATVTFKDNKPANGEVVISASVNGKTKEQKIKVFKSASNVKDIVATASTNGENITKYPHMSSDTIYVDVDECVEISGVVEGTLVNPEKAVGEALSATDLDDLVLVSSTDRDDCFGAGIYSAKKISDTSYSFVMKIYGHKATTTGTLSIITESGQASKPYKVVVLAEAFELGICKEEVPGKTSVKTFEGLYKKEYAKTENNQEDKSQYTCVDNIEGNIANGVVYDNWGMSLVEGESVQLKPLFLSRFTYNAEKKNWEYVCDSTDEAYWESSDANVATVTQDGLVKAVREGNVTITLRAKSTLTSSRTAKKVSYDIYVQKLNLADDIQILRDGQVAGNQTLYTSTGTVTYSAKLLDSESTTANENIVWASSDEKVFTVDGNGNVTPVGAGKATLIATAASSGKQAMLNITVIAAATKLTLNTSNFVGVNGHMYKLTATPNEGADANEKYTWTTTDVTKVALLDPNDAINLNDLDQSKLLSTFKGNTCYVYITGDSGLGKVSVNGEYLSTATASATITLSKAVRATTAYITYGEENVSAQGELSISKGKSYTLNAKLYGESGAESNDDFYWTVEQEGDVVSYDKEKLENAGSLTLTPLTKGDVTVKVTSRQSGKVAAVTLHILVPATSIEMEETQYAYTVITKGTTHKLGVKVVPQDTTDKIVYESSNPNLVSVNENGEITGITPSDEMVTITAKISEELKATCLVKVAIGLESMTLYDDNNNAIENNKDVYVYVGETNTVKFNVTNNANEKVEWTSSNDAIASLKPSIDTHSCVINGNKAGTTKLTAKATASNQTTTINVNVVNRITSFESITVPQKVTYGTSNQSITVQLQANADAVVFTVADPSILSLVPSRNGNRAVATITALKAGKTKVTISSADGRYSEEREIEVVGTNLGSVSMEETTIEYDGKAHKPAITVKASNGDALVESKDYTITYPSDMTTCGMKQIVIKGIGNYTGEKYLSYRITTRDFTKATVKLAATSLTYTGSALTPSVKVTDLGKTLVKDKDYTVSYFSNTNAGTATVTIRAMGGNYNGTKTATFTIKPASITKVKFAKVADLAYNGTAQSPSLSGTFGKTNVYANSSYTVKYSANKNPGKMKITIKGINNFTGSKTMYCYIKPARVNSFAVTLPKAKTIKMTWQKDKTATGYEIYYSTKDTFAKKYRKTITITKNKTITKTVKNLKTGKTYYVKVRSYKKVGSKKVYSDWSNVSTVTIQ